MERIIINHNNKKYIKKFSSLSEGAKNNGAFFYSREICARMIPLIKTDRNWVTVNVRGEATNHAIVFIHNNIHPENYRWLEKYKDLILVCGVAETCEHVAHIGRTIYLPLSVNVAEVEQYKTDKTKDVAFCGRSTKRKKYNLPIGTDFLEDLPREELLRKMAKYKKIYAVGRTAIEGKILGCEILPYDDRFPNPEIWQVLDTVEAAQILQEQLNVIDGF